MTKTATAIIPTIGSDTLKEAIISVDNQTVLTDAHVVVDGPRVIDEFDLEEATFVTRLGENTGKVGENKFWGHRIYSMSPHMTNADYVLFLDDDNTYMPDHVETLIDLCERHNLHFSFSRRHIIHRDTSLVCEDRCESLGFVPVWNTPARGFHVDTSSYCFRRSFLMQVAQYWHYGYAADRRFFEIARSLNGVRYGTTNRPTLNYRLGSSNDSAAPNFFLEGNKVMQGIDLSEERTNV